MSVIAKIGFRPSEMDDYDQNFRRWNGKWGWGNSGTQEMKVDMSNGSIILPVNGEYRVTGVIRPGSRSRPRTSVREQS
jgi:hypothetical protein